MKRSLIVLGSFVTALSGCAQGPGLLSPPSPAVTSSGFRAMGLPNKIQHVVIVIQENRSTDNLFNGFPGADTTQFGRNSLGQLVKLLPVLLTARYDISHRHSAFKIEYDHGNMNGFDLVSSNCRHVSQCPPTDLRAYGYVPQYEVQPYFTMAEQYTFADEMFQTNEGPSFPAHQYLVSGTSSISEGSPLLASENPSDPANIGDQGGCDSLPSTTVPIIDQLGKQDGEVFPCFNRRSIFTLLDLAKIGWKYYQYRLGPGFWHGVDALEPIWKLPEYNVNVVQPPNQVLKDIARGKLQPVSFVTPTARDSDHALTNRGLGPSWVSSIVNALGKSPYWNTTAILVTWDDWGGWYDHLKPERYNSYELGFRVPLIVISPYAKRAFVSHKRHEFGSILKFVEKTFNLGSLGTTDARADDLSDCFNFTQAPRPFVKIAAPYDASYFLREPLSSENPDDDF